MGSETKIKYAPSTKFYLEDKLIRGDPWITRLPFPVQVVELVETYDWVSRNFFATRYAYHDGFFDGIEREFRGFGLVEQLDTEEFATLTDSDSFPVTEATNIEKSSHVPPVLTKTWFHIGMYFKNGQVSRHYADEYYREPGVTEDQFEKKFLLPDSKIPHDLTVDEEREAYRALKGSILREEIYALDKSPKADVPYRVSEHNYSVELVQNQSVNLHSIFFVHSAETVNYNYERNPCDPRITHSLVLDVDHFGNIIRSASVGYGRRSPDLALSADDQKKQTQLLITCVENSYTNNIDLDGDGINSDDAYRTPLPFESSTYELTGIKPTIDAERFDFNKLDRNILTAKISPYEEKPSGGLQKRLIGKSRTIYRSNDLFSSLVGGTIESLGLPFETYKLALTPGLVKKIYENRVTDAMLLNEGGYVHVDSDDANWWIPSGQMFFSPGVTDTFIKELAFAKDHFFIPHRYQDPFGFITTTLYDEYSLLLREMHDPLNNVVTTLTKDENGNDLVALDYRVLMPWIITDPNGNRTAVSFDALGLVAFTAIMGKVHEADGKPKGDILPKDLAVVDLSYDEIENFYNFDDNDPRALQTTAATLLGSASTRVIYNVE